MKMVLNEPEMLVSFIKNFTKIDTLDSIQPTDIEDVPTRHLTLISEQKDSDTIKRINLKGETPLFVITVIEHESKVNYRASFKMLMYITHILDAYEKEVIKKVRDDDGGKNSNFTLLKDFKYPPILPIVFYNGKSSWTAEKNFLHRTEMQDVFHKYIPKFEYELIDLNEYTKDDLIKFGDLLSLLMIMNKVSSADELTDLKTSLPKGYIDKINENVPENLRKLMANVMRVTLTNIDVPQEEIDEIAERIYERGVPEMFSIENYSVRETRQQARLEERIALAKAMIAENESIEKIVKYSKLNLSEVEQLISESVTQYVFCDVSTQ